MIWQQLKIWVEKFGNVAPFKTGVREPPADLGHVKFMLGKDMFNLIK